MAQEPQLTLWLPARKAAALAGLGGGAGLCAARGLRGSRAAHGLYAWDDSHRFVVRAFNFRHGGSGLGVAGSRCFRSMGRAFGGLLVVVWRDCDHYAGIRRAYRENALADRLGSDAMGDHPWSDPATLAMFQQISLVSPVANAIAIPLVSLVVVPLTLLATSCH